MSNFQCDYIISLIIILLLRLFQFRVYGSAPVTRVRVMIRSVMTRLSLLYQQTYVHLQHIPESVSANPVLMAVSTH